MNLVKKEIKLLHALAQNSRASIKELSEKSGYSQESVQKKIEEFQTNTIIKSYSTIININQVFNLQEYLGYITLNSATQQIIQELLTYLQSSKFTSWIGRGIGLYDIKISLYIQHLEQIQLFEQELYSQFPTLIQSIEWNQIISKHKNSSNSIISKCLEEQTLKENIKSVKKIPQNSQLHPMQIQILYELSDNSRISLQELSVKLNTTIENIHYHFKRLQKSNTIKQFSITLDTSYFKQHATILLLKIHSSNTQNIIDKLLSRKNITSIIHVIGQYNIQITLLHNSMQTMFEEIASMQDEFSQDILQTQYFFIHSFYKYPKLPEIIFNLQQSPHQ